MKTSWDRKVWHFHRKVKPTAFGRLGVRNQLLKAEVELRRALPSRSLSIELVFEEFHIELADESGGLDLADRRRRLDLKKRRERLLERKRRLRDAARRRARPRVEDTGIYLWRRRQEWLRTIEASEEDAV